MSKTDAPLSGILVCQASYKFGTNRNQGRHLNPRDVFKKNRTAALAEWCQLVA